MSTEQTIPPPQPEQKDNRQTTWLIVLGGLVVFLVLVVAILVNNREGGGQEAAATIPAPGTALPPATYPTVLPPTPAPQMPYATANDYVNIRSGPSTEYPIYGVAAPGATAEITGKSADNAWWAVKIPTSYAAEGLGWVSADYVTVSGSQNVPVIPPPPLPPDIHPPPPPSNALVVQTVEPVNVRAGPGNEFPSYGKVPAGTPLQAMGISQDGKWVAVSIPTSVAPTGIGWVNATYLQPFDPSSLPLMQP